MKTAAVFLFFVCLIILCHCTGYDDDLGGGYVDIVTLLIENGLPVEAKNSYGETALSMAASKGQDKIAEILLRLHANVNTVNKDAVTPLMYSATHGFIGMTDLLIMNGADVNAVSKEGLTALVYACLNDKSLAAALFERAAVWDEAEQVEQRLRDYFSGRPNISVERSKVKL